MAVSGLVVGTKWSFANRRDFAASTGRRRAARYLPCGLDLHHDSRREGE
jgi:hypothetical protein